MTDTTRLLPLIDAAMKPAEVKRERWWNERLYVEMMQRPAHRGPETEFPWKDSGLRTTKADVWVFVKPGDLVLFVPTQRLRKVIEVYNPIPTACGGDNPTRGYLVEISDLFKDNGRQE